MYPAREVEGNSAIPPATEEDVMPSKHLHVQKQHSAYYDGLRETCTKQRKASTYNGHMKPQAVAVIVKLKEYLRTFQVRV